MSEVRLQVKNLCKNFGITKAVQNVSFNVNKGEVHALIGENGSGKSTLTNMLTGIYSIGSGTFILDGKEIHPKNQVEANNEGVSIIVQELGTLSGLTVAENIFLGHEDQFVHFGIKNTNAMNKKATELLKKYGFDRIKAADMIDNYNFEDRKLVEIVKATYFDPKVVVIDETTTALSQEGREELYKHMERIRKSGNTVIFISHDLPEILDKSDTITILRDGVYIDTVKSKDVTEEDLKKYPHFDNTEVGDFRFVDVDGDGKLDLDKDRTICGNYMPKFTYGFGGKLWYAGFDMDFNFQGVYGNKILNLNKRYLDNMEGNTNGTKIALDRWKSPENPGSGSVNKANRKQTGYNSRTSTWHLESGSYLRLQNLSLGYTLPRALTQKFKVEKMRVYVSGQNLFTITNYSGYNPEVNARPSKNLTPGEDYGTYPLARTYMFGLNLTL